MVSCYSAICFFVLTRCCLMVAFGPAATTSAVADHSLPSMSTMDQLGQRLSNDLAKLANDACGRDELGRKYGSQVFYLEPVHGEDVLEEAIEKLEPLFQRRVRAVEEIAKKAQELAMNHQHDEEHPPQLSQMSFVNAKDWDDPAFNESLLVNRPQFGQSISVNLNSSAVHMPLQVYEGWMWHRYKPIWYEDIDTLHALNWSGRLDEVFAENMKRDHNIHWQYFASKEGLLRLFPAHKWKTHNNQQDMFDARQRPWFTQTISSSKDLLILMDVSGSIHGPTFEMLKITVKRLLGTLTQYDFFNVLQYNETVSSLLPCSDTLIPATTRNKRLIYQALDHIVPLGKASLANALNFTYRYILELDDLRMKNRDASSNCQLAVVLISDGGTEVPLEQIETIANHSTTRQTRVFTLAVGPHPIPTVNLRNISCSTNAFHGAILTYGAIRGKVQGYLQVLSRPLALSLDETLIDWSITYQDAAGGGAVISITKPVFQRGENLSQSLLGVAGVDVPLSTFDQALPGSQLGFSGYKMVITPTGNTILHPRLDQQQQHYIEDPLLVDYEDLEPAGNWTDNLRRQLIDRKNGSQPYNPVMMTPDDKYIIQQKRTWYFRPISKTAYTLAVSIKDGANIILPNLELQGKVPWNTQLVTRAAPWTFCSHVHANYSSSKEAASYFSQLSDRFERGGEDCDQTALSHLLWDLEITSNVSQTWQTDRRFHSRFVVTTGGVTRMESKTRLFLQEDLTDPRNSSLFSRLAQSTNASVLIQPPSSRTGDDFLLAAKVSSKEQLLAVSGALVGKEAIQSVWNKVVGAFNISDSAHLYWLDEGGYVIATNQINAAVGSFIGHSDPQLMQALLLGPGPIYEKKGIVKTSVNCPVFPKSAPISSASLLSARWLSNLSSTVFGTAHIFYVFAISLLWSGTSATFQAEMELDKMRPNRVDTHLCTKEFILYQLRASQQIYRNFSCSRICSGHNDKNREVLTRPMQESNSILVLTGPPCRCDADPPVQHGLVRVENEMEKCNIPKRHRQSPSKCYSSDPRENSLECAAHSIRSPPLMLPSMILTCVIVYILR